TFQSEAGPRSLHIYEAYWAPLTGGRVTLKDVTMFLLRSAWDAVVRRDCKTFSRWMFGNWQDFNLRLSTPLIYAALLLVFSSLVVISATIAAVAAARGLLAPAAKWP